LLLLFLHLLPQIQEKPRCLPNLSNLRHPHKDPRSSGCPPSPAGGTVAAQSRSCPSSLHHTNRWLHILSPRSSSHSHPDWPWPWAEHHPVPGHIYATYSHCSRPSHCTPLRSDPRGNR